MNSLRCVMPDTGAVELASTELAPVVAGRLLVRTLYSLVSPGTELALFNGTHIGLANPNNLFAKYPFAPGYAAVGRIEASLADGFAAGDTVYFYGKHQAMQVIDPSLQVVVPLPAGLDPRLAPFARLAQIAHTALVVAAPRMDRPMAVIGLGLIGNLAAQLYRRAGADVHAFDTRAARCDWARASGLDHAVHVTGDLRETVERAVGGKVATCVEATGVGALVPVCLQLVEDLGTVVLLGSPRDQVCLDAYDLIHRPGTRLIGAHERVVPVIAETGLDQRQVSRDMLAAIADGSLGIAPLLSNVISPMELGAYYRALEHEKDRVLGVLLDWSGLPAS